MSADHSNRLREATEIARVTDDLATLFPEYQPETLEALVVAEFGRRSGTPIQDFVPVFVERALKQRLRARR